MKHAAFLAVAGTLTLLWVRGDEGRLAERARDCLL